jgi:hypothetical protein
MLEAEPSETRFPFSVAVVEVTRVAAFVVTDPAIVGVVKLRMLLRAKVFPLAHARK